MEKGNVKWDSVVYELSLSSILYVTHNCVVAELSLSSHESILFAPFMIEQPNRGGYLLV